MSQKMRPLITSSEVGNLDPAKIRAVVQAVHVLPADEGWVVRKSGPDRTNQVFPTKPEAERFAHKLSADQNVEVIVHSKTAETLRREFYKA